MSLFTFVFQSLNLLSSLFLLGNSSSYYLSGFDWLDNFPINNIYLLFIPNICFLLTLFLPVVSVNFLDKVIKALLGIFSAFSSFLFIKLVCSKYIYSDIIYQKWGVKLCRKWSFDEKFVFAKEFVKNKNDILSSEGMSVFFSDEQVSLICLNSSSIEQCKILLEEAFQEKIRSLNLAKWNGTDIFSSFYTFLHDSVKFLYSHPSYLVGGSIVVFLLYLFFNNMTNEISVNSKDISELKNIVAQLKQNQINNLPFLFRGDRDLTTKIGVLERFFSKFNKSLDGLNGHHFVLLKFLGETVGLPVEGDAKGITNWKNFVRFISSIRGSKGGHLINKPSDLGDTNIITKFPGKGFKLVDDPFDDE